MTKKQFREALDALGVHNQAEAAALLGVTLRTVNGYANNADIPVVVERFLALLIATKTPIQRYL